MVLLTIGTTPLPNHHNEHVRITGTKRVLLRAVLKEDRLNPLYKQTCTELTIIGESNQTNHCTMAT